MTYTTEYWHQKAGA